MPEADWERDLSDYFRRTPVNLYPTRRKASRRERVAAEVPERPAPGTGSSDRTEDRVDLGRALTGRATSEFGRMVGVLRADGSIVTLSEWVTAETQATAHLPYGADQLRSVVNDPNLYIPPAEN
jgi:hypothetical protein